MIMHVLLGMALLGGSPFAGRWEGKLEGLPGVTLTVKENQGKVAGSIIFYLIRKDVNGARVDGDAKCELLQATAKGKRLTFEVKHHVTHDSQIYGPNVKFMFNLTGENEGILTNASEEGPPVRMVREP
jgi:hypothetical protein